MLRVVLIVALLLGSSVGSHADEIESPPSLACTSEGDGCFVGRDGRIRDPEAAYLSLQQRYRPQRLRAWLEMAAFIGAGTAWYWIDRERQVADWDFPSIEQRITFEAWRFDNNPFPINFFWHAFNGVGFHLVARSNDLSLLGATGVGFATSMAWEYLLEFREKVSINDVITTTTAGVAAGEFLHWLGRYLSSGRPGSTGRDVAKWSLGFWRALHNRIDGRSEPHVEPDDLGFSADIWHRFHLGYGAAIASVDIDGTTVTEHGLLQWLSARGRLAALPGYLQPGRFQQWFDNGNLTALDVRVDLGDGAGADVLADTMLFGIHSQVIPLDGIGRALTLGATIGYRYRKENYHGWKDRLGLVHLPGAGVDQHLLWRDTRLRLSGRLHPDFAGVHAPSYGQWKAANPGVQEKTILRKHGYYYAWGYSARLEAAVSNPYIELGSAIWYARYFSAEGFDRSQEDVTADVPANDRVLDIEAWLRIMPFGGRLFAELRYTRQHRRDEVGGFASTARLRRLLLQLGARL